jgi:acyl-coenzyme A thioesterase PaaI-like protein
VNTGTTPWRRPPIDQIATGFIAGLGAKLWVDGQWTRSRFEVTPSFLKPGTQRVRLGVVSTLIDVVAGAPAHGLVNPTVDLRVSLLKPLPTSGFLELVCRPVSIGEQLFVAETLVYDNDPTKPFARSTCTYVNRTVEGYSHDNVLPDGSLEADFFDDLLPLRQVDDRTFELDNSADIGNPRNSTIQGGVQGFFAELATERALAATSGVEHEVVDLDVRYLNSLRTPTARARVETFGGSFGTSLVRVPIMEADDGERIVSLATLRCRPVEKPCDPL